MRPWISTDVSHFRRTRATNAVHLGPSSSSSAHSLSDIVTPGQIEHHVNLAHGNMPLEEYPPFEANGGDGLVNAEHVAKRRVRRENASPALDGLQAEVARGGDGHRPPRFRRFLFSLVFFLSHHRRENMDLLHQLRAWIQNRTLPRVQSEQESCADGGRARRGKVRAAMKMLVAARGMEETVEAEKGLMRSWRAIEAEERRQRKMNTWGTMPTASEEGGEHEK
ncbi:hypothetical protein FIBSPDRAFT_887526 [Athelia psychrophila]|uniref:Uncharacterized protein n=1 Tax=Athelia psychrophila TaxID=1759441 RepID=A0A166PJ46_9AGAM|nr:hypothetical protein FIBSPDRAFT_887526 [Fibularhizoctonia sp. CBS 109695]